MVKKKNLLIFIFSTVVVGAYGAFQFFHLFARGVFVSCPLNWYTGLQCPACGGTRAVFYLLRGDITAALRLNAFIVILAGFLPFWLLVARWRRSAIILWVVAGLFILFGIVRNIPVRLFCLLS